MDKMIKYANSLDDGVNLFYSTPSCYVKALNEAGQNDRLIWPTKTDDFFPYSSDPNAYWTGYFTSRPNFKGMVRKTNNFFQVNLMCPPLNKWDFLTNQTLMIGLQTITLTCKWCRTDQSGTN